MYTDQETRDIIFDWKKRLHQQTVLIILVVRRQQAVIALLTCAIWSGVEPRTVRVRVTLVGIGVYDHRWHAGVHARAIPQVVRTASGEFKVLEHTLLEPFSAGRVAGCWKKKKDTHTVPYRSNCIIAWLSNMRGEFFPKPLLAASCDNVGLSCETIRNSMRFLIVSQLSSTLSHDAAIRSCFGKNSPRTLSLRCHSTRVLRAIV